VSEPTSAPGRYVRRYRTTARQLTDFSIALDWYKTGVPVDDAIAWADLGYMPGEAAAHIAAGRTPTEVAVAEAAEVAAAGGPEAHLRDTLRALGDVMLIDPDVAEQFGLDQES
jgi:hypothetical protein